MPWMKEMIAPGKINLYLNITGKREDHYHTLDTVMQTVEMADLIQAQMLTECSAIRHFNEMHIPVPDGAELGSALSVSIEMIWFSRPGQWLSEDEILHNTCYKAAKLFWMHAVGLEGMAVGPKQYLIIRIHKRIPTEAGLGGGSADAAALLDILWQVYGKPFPREELDMLALNTGADVPFCLHGGTKYCTGIGEKISFLPSLPAWEILIIKPNHGSSTVEAFKRYDEAVHGNRIDQLISESFDSASFRTKLTEIAFNAKAHIQDSEESVDLSDLQKFGGNSFIPLIEPAHPKVKPLLNRLQQLYPKALTSLSGSGSACFVLFGAREAGIDLHELHELLDSVLGQGAYKLYRTRLKKGRFGTDD